MTNNAPHSRWSQLRSVFGYFLLGVLIVEIFFLWTIFGRPVSGVYLKGSQTVSASHMRQIAIAASVYKSDHGSYPVRLSQLVPDYLNDTCIFYLHTKYDNAIIPPNAMNESTDPKLIDAQASYAIQQTSGGGAVIYERFTWKDGRTGYYFVTDNTTDLQKQLMPHDACMKYLRELSAPAPTP